MLSVVRKMSVIAVSAVVLAGFGVAAQSSDQDTWRTWSGESVGVENAVFFAIDHEWFAIQIKCLTAPGANEYDHSEVEVYYQDRGMDEYAISINGSVYSEKIIADSRVGMVQFKNFLKDIRSGGVITIMDMEQGISGNIANRRSVQKSVSSLKLSETGDGT